LAKTAELAGLRAHEFLQPDGTIMSLIPEFHPMFSLTEIRVV
jgi:hypothetical protein